jgi:hypothetical protein
VAAAAAEGGGAAGLKAALSQFNYKGGCRSQDAANSCHEQCNKQQTRASLATASDADDRGLKDTDFLQELTAAGSAHSAAEVAAQANYTAVAVAHVAGTLGPSRHENLPHVAVALETHSPAMCRERQEEAMAAVVDAHQISRGPAGEQHQADDGGQQEVAAAAAAAAAAAEEEKEDGAGRPWLEGTIRRGLGEQHSQQPRRTRASKRVRNCVDT